MVTQAGARRELPVLDDFALLKGKHGIFVTKDEEDATAEMRNCAGILPLLGNPNVFPSRRTER